MSGSSAQALRSLRELAGLTPDEAADRAGLSLAVLSQAEQQGPDAKTATRLASVFGIESGALLRNEPVANAADQDASLFLFSGDLASFAPADLPAFSAALDYGRTWVEGEGQAGLRARLFHQPLMPAGPANGDAARQGYRLARQLRAALKLGATPIGDIAELAERELGVVIVVERLFTTNLGAGAILDAERSAAAIVLNETLEARRHRVALAHELCHLLFDPSGAEMVSFTLDAPALHGTSGFHDLKEARARGFAAELLLPVSGLLALLGPRRATSSLAEARDMIERARGQFGTTWEITANHLYNTQFISRGAWEDLPYSSNPRAVDLPATTLPAVNSSPCCLAGAPIPSLPSPELAASARKGARDMSRRLDEERCHEAARIVEACMEQSADAPMRAGVNLTKALDDAFTEGDPALVEEVLRQLDPRRIHGDTLVMALSGVRRASEAHGAPLVEAYRTSVARLLDALPVTWSWDEEDVSDARDTLLGAA